jgi:tetratricopeptide (TPR) repeat protein
MCVVVNLTSRSVSGRGGISRPIGIVLLSFFSFASSAAATGPAAAVEGVVRDTRDAPVAAASVSLTKEQETPVQTVSTDVRGMFSFNGLAPGAYVVRAKMAGFEEASSPIFSLGQGEAKRINLTLKMAQASDHRSKKLATPEFSDEPNFTVAGVTDSTNLGGHGSDVVVRNRESLAKETASLGDTPSASSLHSALPAANEKYLRAAVERDAASFDANYQLGRLLVHEGKAREAIPYLDHASQIKPGVYENEYELALAHCAAGDYDVASDKTRLLLARQDKAELHRLLGEAEEKRGHPLESVRQYQRAVELDPNEANYFDWGSELLLHQAAEPAIEVFTKGSRLFPGSVRMASALGAAWYVRGAYEQAVDILCRASDLDPASTTPYMFLGRIQNVEKSANIKVVEKLARFVRMEPENAWANYYYAVSLWKQRTAPDDNKNLPKIELLLKTAVRIEPKLTAAHLQLGNLYFEQKNFPGAIDAYQKAVATAPDLSDAHYRLAQAYRQVGEKLKAQQELELYRQTSKKAAEEVERERHEVQQFVYTLRDQDSESHPQ